MTCDEELARIGRSASRIGMSDDSLDEKVRLILELIRDLAEAMMDGDAA